MKQKSHRNAALTTGLYPAGSQAHEYDRRTISSAIWNPATTEGPEIVPRWQVSPTPVEITPDRADVAMVPQHVPPRRGVNGSGHRNHGARDIKDGTCTPGPTPPSAPLGHFDADNQGLEVKGSLQVSLQYRGSTWYKFRCIHQGFCLGCSCRSYVILLCYATPRNGSWKYMYVYCSRPIFAAATSVHLPLSPSTISSSPSNHA